MQTPVISIITASYNSEKYISETIESVLNQTYENWEWIISDDGSTDNTVSIIESFKDPRIKLVQSSQNSGAAVARNKALDLAQGRYITFIDSDDLWKPEFLEKSLHYLQTENEQLVYSSYERKDENLNPKLRDFIAPDKVTYQRILYNCPIPMLTAMYDSKEIGKIKIPEVEKREDHAMWISILKKIKFARAINETLGIYRIRENSYSRNKFELIKFQFALYHKYLHLSFATSAFYTITWAINGFFKYK